ncbi:MAG: hypothetical protein HYR75_10265 [Gemmatimonadetes bacterium]|nr:hypothetical protein [Gemmatimonadota bacterium]MBI3504508.1 hypothetical protein [Pseudomonadota bacterium]
MRTKSRLRGVALSILCCTVAACSKPDPDAQRKVDPNLPAVVKLAPPVLPSDTAKKPVEMPAWAGDDSLRVHTMRNFAILGAMMAFKDERSTMLSYDPHAELVLQDSTVRGAKDIAATLVAFAKQRSMGEFVRTTRAMHVDWKDSTALDSGTYTIETQRDGGQVVKEGGHFVTRWRLHPPPTEWAILRDELKPDRGARKKVN